MPANHSSSAFHYLAGKYPNSLGWLIGPRAIYKTTLRQWIPYALDNDAFSAWTNKTAWDGEAWYKMLIWAKKSGIKPMWALCPDVVANKDATLENWNIYSPLIKSVGWQCAFAVQDGMIDTDVPEDADLIFVGGTTEWKWSTMIEWASKFKRVHVGRVNEMHRLEECFKAGVESIDGTGWFRDTTKGRRFVALEKWLEQQKNMRHITHTLPLVNINKQR